MDDLGLTLTTLVDDIENRTARAYSAWPDRLFLVDRTGRIAYAGGPGPWGFSVEELETALRKLDAAREANASARDPEAEPADAETERAKP